MSSFNLTHRQYSGFLPWIIPTMTTAQLAALNTDNLYPSIVPLAQICKWWWLAQVWTATWKASYHSSLETGSDAYTGPASAGTNMLDGALASVPSSRTAPLSVAPLPFGVGGFYGLSFTSPGTNTFTSGGSGTYTAPVSVFLFYFFNSNPPVIQVGTDYYPQMGCVSNEGRYFLNSDPTSGPTCGNANIDGISVPLYYNSAEPDIGTVLTVTFSIALSSIWT